MNNNHLISVIIPVYNMERYIRQCIASVINQTYKNIEIIIVDDGSTDSSYNICKKYAKNYKNIKLFHKENGGLSSARNTGIDKSSGKYITFVDADDRLDSDFIRTLYNNLVESKADISIGKLMKIHNDKTSPLKSNKTTVIMDGLEKIKYFLKTGEYYACGVIYDKALFKNIIFPIDKYYEDIDTVYKLFLKAKCICYTKYNGYFYYLRKNSISMSHSLKKVIDGYSSSINMYSSINKKYPDLNENTVFAINSIIHFMFIYKKIKGSDNKQSNIYRTMNIMLNSICNNKFKLFFLLNTKNKIKYIYMVITEKDI